MISIAKYIPWAKSKILLNSLSVRQTLLFAPFILFKVTTKNGYVMSLLNFPNFNHSLFRCKISNKMFHDFVCLNYYSNLIVKFRRKLYAFDCSIVTNSDSVWFNFQNRCPVMTNPPAWNHISNFQFVQRDLFNRLALHV